MISDAFVLCASLPIIPDDMMIVAKGKVAESRLLTASNGSKDGTSFLIIPSDSKMACMPL
ncbi:MAG: hypothetical protein GX111_04905 [Clostridiales bacterium]|nr:hypothetical protein [Clostridiales bacterium]